MMEPQITFSGSNSTWALIFRRFIRHKLAVTSAIFLIILTSLAAGAPLIEFVLDIDANEVNLPARFAKPSADAWLGRDELGRDVLLRLMFGGQVSILVGFCTAICAAVIGTIVGLIAGYHGGWLDRILMRTTDSVIALPLLPLLIVLAGLDLRKLGLPNDLIESEMISLYRIIFIIALLGWTTVARLVRGAALTVRERDYVLAAQAQGAGNMRIIRVHVLPNLLSPIIVATMISVGTIIIVESVLSFLGLGIQPPIPSWGNLLTNSHELIYTAHWLAIYPGIAIIMTVVAFNFLGEGLQEAMDPKAEI